MANFTFNHYFQFTIGQSNVRDLSDWSMMIGSLCANRQPRWRPALIFIERVQTGTEAQLCAKIGSVWPFYSAGGANASIPAFHVAGNDAINVVPLRPGLRSRFFAACLSFS